MKGAWDLVGDLASSSWQFTQRAKPPSAKGMNRLPPQSWHRRWLRRSMSAKRSARAYSARSTIALRVVMSCPVCSDDAAMHGV
jgi:hypothetical protein